jgi:long-chain acyl-CoA synthetase
LFFGGNLRFISCGGAKLDYKTAKMYDDMGIIIIQGYGSSETAALISSNNIKDYKIDSVGKIMEGQKVKIIDVDSSGAGELCVKGDNVTRGYYNNPKLNEEVFDEEGYFRTGDLVYFDKEERLHIVGRKKRVIITSNGKNVYPDELEEILINNQNIKEAFVYSNNNKIYADIVLENKNFDINKHIKEINEQLPKYKQVNFVNICEKLKEKLM